MASKAEATQLAAEQLRLIPIGQTMQSQQQNVLNDGYDEVYAQLQVKGLATWLSTAEMPDEVTPHFVTLVCHNKMEIVGVSQDNYNRILFKAGNEGEKAIGNIRNLVEVSFSTDDIETDY